VDVELAAPVADPRARYQLSREVAALGPPAPAFPEAQKALASPRPVLARSLTREEARNLAELLEARGLPARTTPQQTSIAGSVSSSAASASSGAGAWSRIAIGALAAGILLAAAVLWLRPGRASRDEVPVAIAKEGPAPIVPVSSAPLSPRGIADLATPSTVMLRSGNSLGSGFFVDNDLVLTNAHVVADGNATVTAVFSDGREIVGSVERRNESIDLALVRVRDSQAEPLRIGDATSLHTGDRVVFIGTPEGLAFTVHEGIVSNTSRQSLGVAYLQLDANVNPGNSGGPVLDSQGRVVGVVTAKVQAGEGLGLMLPINYAYEGGSSLIAAPSPAPDSGKWRTLLAHVEEEDRQKVERVTQASRRAILLGVARAPGGGALYAAIGRFDSTSPASETVFFTLRRPDRMVCGVTSAVERWQAVEVNAFGKDPHLMRWLEKNGISQTLYQGVALLNLKECPAEEIPGSELVLEGAAEGADRVSLPDQPVAPSPSLPSPSIK
jgi:serine protease Do